MPVHLTVRRHQVSVSLLVLGLHLLFVLAWWHQARATPVTRRSLDSSSVSIWLRALPELPAQQPELAAPGLAD